MRVLAVSPHLDDAAFSVGATLAVLADAGHEVTVLTCLTRSVPDPTGFALACQTDKGLGPDVDYMALRRAEDAAAMAVLGAHPVHLDLPEAPHRGYISAGDLFAGVHPGDDLWRQLADALTGYEADLWLAPQGLGGHVDHLQVLRAVASLDRPTAWWRDSPYVLRAPDAVPGAHLPGGVQTRELPGDRGRRADACACYTTQLGFQFGGPDAMREALAGLGEPLLAGPAARTVLDALG
ncbi:PIG-L family deacetylase [Modestobacter sp. I12A-02628]|uniref:PIG-L family deacetylase n=1 Tax=Goekera deserti TaxID=2497753 RepID=A0A7K3WF00_9ACTN|nr:PIG-L family deacetylase [Goekera deserti]MPQ96994.1 PIG-L family deacetylase [Goekera deserti]NDI46691.1 PIG-L family deacetylase [Goekera deserti]NEL54260.1 PIG-L family deacetylase [Goekera deserti]